MHKKIVATLAALALSVTQACAQIPGQFPSGNLYANAGASTALPQSTTPSAWIDRWCSAAVGFAPIRIAAGWTCRQVSSVCDIRYYGAASSTVGTGNAAANDTAIAAAMTACNGNIYIPAVAQIFDSQNIPTVCFDISATIVHTAALNGGVQGAGPNASCLNQTVASRCVLAPTAANGLVIANVTLRHTGTQNVNVAPIGKSFNASISGTTLNVTAVFLGSLRVGDVIVGAGVAGTTAITAFGTGSGGTGTYTVSVSQTIGAEGMTASGAAISTSSTFPGCGADMGYLSYLDNAVLFNVVTAYNYIGRILGGINMGMDIHGRGTGNFADSIYAAFCGVAYNTPPAGCLTTSGALGWEIVDALAFFNGGHAYSAKCLKTDIPILPIIGMRTAINGFVNQVLPGATGSFTAYTLEIDGETNNCAVDDFNITSSFLGEGNLGEVWLHSAGQTPYIIDNVSFESPGNCQNGVGNGLFVGNTAQTGNTNATTPVLINGAIMFGCGGLSNKGIGIDSANFCSIANSSVQSFATQAIDIGLNGGGAPPYVGPCIISNTFALTSLTGVRILNGAEAITTQGVTAFGNTNNVQNLGAVRVSHTGDWCGTAFNSLLPCAWNDNTGTVTLIGASPITVSNKYVTATSTIVFTLNTIHGTVGAYPAIQTITPGTGFTVSGTALDNSVYNYAITN